jgi:hypothetical protein
VVAAAVDDNDDLGTESLDEAEDGWHCSRVCYADGDVDGEGVATGDGHEVRGVKGVDVEDGELEEDTEVSGEAGEVLVDELQSGWYDAGETNAVTLSAVAGRSCASSCMNDAYCSPMAMYKSRMSMQPAPRRWSSTAWTQVMCTNWSTGDISEKAL